MNDFANRLEGAKDIADVFEVVKAAVRESLGKSRAGLMLGLSPLGFAPEGFIGAYHQPGSNLIVMNSSLLRKIQEERPEKFRAYAFHLLLHEYLHSLGMVEEERCRAAAWHISRECFGEGHLASRIAEKFEAFLPQLRHAGGDYQPPQEALVTLVPGFDREATSYIG
ncbi:MAG: hypothetical protein HY520_00080 [Candidatus Aenigmarchaeota archaeon]|nr:hypothetical protein [Candidatus Aenigmarchaeota archaeon]